MSQVQAIALSCSEPELTNQLPGFFENTLNLYAVDPRVVEGGIKVVFEGGASRDSLFQEFEAAIREHEAPKIILINHQNCVGYGGSSSFQSPEEEIRQHELQLRHAVSDFHARFPEKEVEAYLALLEKGNANFKKVI